MMNDRLYDCIDESDIAIIGMAGRFPGAEDIYEFWENLKNGVTSISTFSNEELLACGVAPDVLRHPKYVKAGYVLSDMEFFDASFFGYNPREAELIDPQQRILLECAWEALENAGYDLQRYQGLVGVFVGTGVNTYLYKNLLSNPGVIESMGWLQTIAANEKDYSALRLSYKLDLKGPSVSVQTACSTSLVAIHLASQSILNGECDMALAGGASVRVSQKLGYMYEEGSILSPDGFCRAFDARAAGTVPSSGVGIVVLKSAREALKDRDFIHAVIKGSATNNDGSSKVGFTAPSIEGQAAAIMEARAVAGVSPQSITYIEAHGTATLQGDPIEIAALTRAYASETDKTQYCAIGSLKTNVGHLDAASGVAGVIKVAMSMQHKLMPPSLHFEKPNPKINFTDSQFYVNSVLSEWESSGGSRRAGVSSFGLGGVNTHIIIEEAPSLRFTGASRSTQLLVLSARSKTALEVQKQRLTQHLQSYQDLHFADVAYTLGVGRKMFPYRVAITCQSTEEAINALRNGNGRFTSVSSGRSRQPIIFMLPGQGVQHLGMASELYREECFFREQFQLCSDIVEPLLGLNLCDVVYPAERGSENDENLLTQTRVAQPVIFAIEYAMAKLWMSWGVCPSAMIGHSIGEYVAACLAGVFSLEDALTVVTARGKLMQALPSGAMLAASLTEDAARGCSGSLSIAAVNLPTLCVLSGPNDDVDALQTSLSDKRIECSKLHVSHAFHSHMMTPIVESLIGLLKSVEMRPPSIPIISCVTGGWIREFEAIDPSYWADHALRTVRFSDGLGTVMTESDSSDSILLEVGPGNVLSSLAKKHPSKTDHHRIFSSMPHIQDPKDSLKAILSTLGDLWSHGVDIDWAGFYAHEHRRRVSLPTYPFDRQRYWVEPVADVSDSSIAALVDGHSQASSASGNNDVEDWFYVPSWKRSQVPASPLWSKDCCCAVFADDNYISNRLTDALRDRGYKFVLIQQGKTFSQLDDNTFTLNPSVYSDYEMLIKSLCINGMRPNRAVHFWRMPMDNKSTQGASCNSGLQAMCSIIYLARAFDACMSGEDVRLLVVTNSTQEVIGDETIIPEEAIMLGPVKVIPKEYPTIDCRNVDIVSAGFCPPNESVIIDHLLCEIDAEVTSANRIVAIRGNHRWVQMYERYQIADKLDEVGRLRENGTYLITGGMGGIGLTLAEHLAKKVKAKLILVGRSGFPPKEQWNEILYSAEASSSIKEKIEKLQACEEAGSEIILACADVACCEDMRHVITEACKQFGTINGVIHAAGIAGGGMLHSRTKESMEAVLAPKVNGALVLDALFNDSGLDFMIFCSSLTSVMGEFGQTDYCSANLFLDSLAHNRCARGAFTISIGWDAWQEIGMAVKTEMPDSIPDMVRNWRNASLKMAIKPIDGLRAFDMVMSCPLPHILVSPQNLNKKLKNGDLMTLEILKKNSQTSKPKHKRPELESVYVKPQSELEITIANIWGDVLGLDNIGITDDFIELGGHSLLASQVISRLNKTFGISLPLSSLFEFRTVAALSAHIAGSQQSLDAVCVSDPEREFFEI